MLIAVVGINHKTAPIEIRERLSFPAGRLKQGLSELKKKYGVNESVIISTCNRVEVYVLVREFDKGVADIKRFMSEFHNIPEDDFEKYIYAYSNEKAIKHLLQVAASLDSMVIGESQVFGQVKEAYLTAFEVRATGTVFNGLFHRVINIIKKVRTDTEIGKKSVSVSSVAVDLAGKIFNELKEHKVMIVGSGKMSELTAKYLVDSGVKAVFVSNRTFSKAQELAKKFNGEAIKFDEYLNYMVESDIVICSAGAPHYIIRQSDVTGVMRIRKNRPMFFIDISVPRNVDPAIDSIDNVYLYNVDDLQGLANENKKVRENAVSEAEKIIEQGAGEIMAWCRSLELVPTIVLLQKKAEQLRLQELNKSIVRLKSVSEEDKEKIDLLTRSIIKKMLSLPIDQLKRKNEEGSAFEYTESLNYLFKLDEIDRE